MTIWRLFVFTPAAVRFMERLENAPLQPLIQKTRTCISSILKDTEFNAWFDYFFSCSRQNPSEPGYARSEEAQSKRHELCERWKILVEKDDKWRKAVDNIKIELQKIEVGLKKDEDLKRVKDAHEKFGRDMEEGLAEAGTGMHAAIEQVTWFWQDLFKVYVPRTEYMDDEIEFVLENLHISSFNILPSHVDLRNITDVDITTLTLLRLHPLSKHFERREEAKAKEMGTSKDLEIFSRRAVKVTREHNEECRRLLKLMGIPVVCAELARGGKVYSAGLEDMDMLILFRYLTFSEAKKQLISEINLKAALEGLDVNMSQFTDLCILLGCDYLEPIRGIGPKSALKLIEEHGGLKGIVKYLREK